MPTAQPDAPRRHEHDDRPADPRRRERHDRLPVRARRLRDHEHASPAGSGSRGRTSRGAAPLSVGVGLNVALAAGNIQPDNSRLVSYNGHLLYTWFNDHVPGDATGQAINNFFVLDASGNKIP